jgi:hypothetical protein
MFPTVKNYGKKSTLRLFVEDIFRQKTAENEAKKEKIL